ncbi:hypothetical protein [Pararcticibacter amylolyticus]|uniref:Cthe-2314-like HEPN domain-containing protein n=1 Tax=Pararcticibacter amylolyticus TaxID=2173175 RepID=A0A2U2PD58_9SPHI|nr:hypothetical protein [Pararcticibacter amylolyticus]PWG79290.1 hypothetical protein DDR33_17360 [Pararcticibacter amylolyticus]
MEALHAWYEEIITHIQKTNLKNLSEYAPSGKNIFAAFSDVTRSKQVLKKFSYSDFKHADDFNYLSMDFIYAIAIIEILQPRINNAVKEGGTYDQSLEDHLYLRYASYGLQTLYSYWDRIGDLLDFFFDTGQKGDVYLSRVLDRFPAQYQSATFHALNNLYRNKVLPLLTERHSTVHTFTLKAKYFWGVIEHGGTTRKS